MKKWWVKALLLAVVVLAALWLTILGSAVRSRNKVEEYKDQLRAAGEKLKIEELIPPRLPPGKNSAEVARNAISRLSSSWGILGSNPPPAMRLIEPGRAMAGWQQPEIRSWDATNTWEEVELELAERADALDSLRNLPDHPQFDFEPDYSLGPNIRLPLLAGTKNLVQPLSAAVLFELHRDDPLSATTNLHTMLALVNGLNNEPILISQLVRAAMAAIAFSAQWEWLQATNLADADLALLQRDWTALEFVKPMEAGLIMERAMIPMSYQHWRTSNAPPVWPTFSPAAGARGSGSWLGSLNDAVKSAKSGVAFSIWRASWSQTDELSILKGIQALIETSRQIQTNGAFKDALAEQNRRFKALGLDKRNDNWLRDTLDDDMRQMLGTPESLSKALNRVLAIEISRQMAITAIALKRHTVRHGAAPADLHALVPAFLPAVPRDPVDGLPLRYRSNADGTFVLYSIGEDGVDDGGDPTPVPPTRSRDLRRGRDFVWPQPATGEEIRIWEEKPASEK
jgi:hypothetical protein